MESTPRNEILSLRTFSIRKFVDTLSEVYRNFFAMVGRRVLFWIVTGIVTSIVLAFIEFGVIVFLQLFLGSLGFPINERLRQGPVSALVDSRTLLLMSLLLIGITRSLAQMVENQASAAVFEGMNLRLRSALLYHLLMRKDGAFSSAGVTHMRLTEEFPKSAFFCFSLMLFASISMQCLFLFGFMLKVAFVESMIGIIGLGLVIIPILFLNQRSKVASSALQDQQKDLSSGIERISRNWLLVKILKVEKKEYGKLSASIVEYSSQTLRANALGYSAAALAPCLGIVLVVVIIHFSFRSEANQPHNLIAFLYLFIRFVQNLSQLSIHGSSMYSRRTQFFSSLKFISTFSKTERIAIDQQSKSVGFFGRKNDLGDKFERGKHQIVSKEASPQAPTICCQAVSFAYPGSRDYVFRDLSFTIPRGEQFGIVGHSGSGKSTLIGVVLGILKTTKGKVLLNGVTNEEFFCDPQVRVGYVGAEPLLIEGTIRDNLLYGQDIEGIDDARCWEALGAAELRSAIESFGENLEYRLSENGDGLSAGQKQRLSLARALIGQPQVLILDEASANLDEVTEGSIAKTIAGLKGLCTTIIVSHRPGFLKYCDQVIELTPPK